MLLDVSSVVIGLSDITGTVRRRGESVLDPDTGVFEDGDEEVFESSGSFQPLTGKELATLESLEDVKNMKAFWTVDRLRVSNKNLGHLADLFEFEAETYEIRKVEDFNSLGGYTRVLMAKITNRREIDKRD